MRHPPERIGDAGVNYPCVCPECAEEFPGLEALSDHIEIHRDKGEPTHRAGGKVTVLKCPRGCGRWLVKPFGGSDMEYQHHVDVCTGPGFWYRKTRLRVVYRRGLI